MRRLTAVQLVALPGVSVVAVTLRVGATGSPSGSMATGLVTGCSIKRTSTMTLAMSAATMVRTKRRRRQYTPAGSSPTGVMSGFNIWWLVSWRLVLRYANVGCLTGGLFV